MINQDSYPDVIVGAPNYNGYPYSNNGLVRIYHGGSGGFNTSPSWGFSESQNNATFGFSVACGDLNGDGFSDLIVGAPNENNWGAVFVYLNGGSDPHTSPDQVLGGYAYGSGFGYSLASGFDQNGDGKQDMLVGAPYAPHNSMTQAGEAYLYRGTSTGVNLAATWTEGGTHNTYEYFGTSVALGDMDSDGYADIIVGAPGYNSPPPAPLTQNGRANLYFTLASGDFLPSHSAAFQIGFYSGIKVGTSVAFGKPLVNGVPDMIAAAPYGTQSAVLVWRYSP
jgi:hypothetical protein